MAKTESISRARTRRLKRQPRGEMSLKTYARKTAEGRAWLERKKAMSK